jgi:serine phosphatase RsbU (regulator of sigma subunit)
VTRREPRVVEAAGPPAMRRRDWAQRFARDEAHAAPVIAAALYLVGAALTATAVVRPHVNSAAVAAIATVACATAAALLLAARRQRGGLALAFAADLWAIVLIALMCAVTGGAASPFALLYIFAVCHAAAFQPRRRFALAAFAALAAFLAPVLYGGVTSAFASVASVGVVLALLTAWAIHIALARIREQRGSLQFMIAATAKLDTSLDPSQTVRMMAHSAVPELAELCVIDLIDRERWIETVAAARDPGLAVRVEQMRRLHGLDLSGSHPVARALATGQAQLVADLSDPAELHQAAQSDEHLRFMRGAGYRSAAVFPLAARRRTHGTISFLRVGTPRGYSEAELGVLEDLARRAALAYDNARLYAERAHIASTLQRSLMPPKLPEIPWLGLASHFRPTGAANRVGGDFYDAFGDEHRCWLVVGDVCGKGPEAAAMTGLVRQSIRAYARTEPSPGDVLARVNNAMLDQGFAEGFATAVLVSLQPRGELIEARVVAAGHPPALIVRRGGATEELGSGTLLGMFRGARSREVSAWLTPGDALALYTDGLTEAHAPQRLVSVSELTAPLCKRAPRSAHEVLDVLLRPIAADGELRDDVAILTALTRATSAPSGRASNGLRTTAAATLGPAPAP